MWTDDTTPVAERDFIDMEYEYGFDEPQIHDNSKFINNSIQNWKHIDLEIQYDSNKPKDNSQYFINQSKENWEYIDKDYHTKMSDGDMSVSNVNITYKEDEEEFLEDRDSSIYAGDNFINKSTKNWKYIK